MEAFLNDLRMLFADVIFGILNGISGLLSGLLNSIFGTG